MIQNILVNGVTLALVYGLLAVGFALIFGVARVANFAHTAFYMAAIYLFYTGVSILHVHPAIAIIGAAIIPIIVAVAYYKLFLDRVKHHHLAVVMLTVALAVIIQEIVIINFGTTYLGVEALLPGYIEIMGIRITNQNIIAGVVCIITLVAVLLFLALSKWGKAIRAVAQDEEIASLMGIDVGMVFLVTMTLSATLASVAGLAMAPMVVMEPAMWATPLVIILAACVLGGMGSITGSIIGAVILAFVEVAVVVILPQGSHMRGVVSMVAMIAVLMWRPEGMFGAVFEEERL